MNYIDCKNLYMFNLNQPTFDYTYNIFISKFNNDMNIKYTVKLNEIIEEADNLQLKIEFLHSSNSLYSYVMQLDNKVKTEIILNGPNWFGDSLNADTINNMFKQSIQLPGKLPGFPTMDLKISENCEVYGISGKRKMAINKLKPNMEIEIGFSVDGVYFYKNKCNLVYYVNHIRVINNVCLIWEDLFSSDDENEIDQIDDLTLSVYN